MKNKCSKFEWPILTKETKNVVLNQMNKTISIYNHSGIIKYFEDKFAGYHDRKFALLTNSGTNALYSAYVGIGLKYNDEVICPAYTFFATVTPLFFIGAIPILCDIDKYGNIDPEDIEKKITKNTKAIMVTHMWGNPCQMDKITKIAKKYNLKLLEDCSHAHGAKYDGKFVGTFGDAAAWSIQGPKTISGGEGGILATDDKEIYYKSLLLGHYNKRCKQEIPADHELSEYSTTGMGLKFRSHPLGVAIADEQFDKLNYFLDQREKNARIIYNELSKIEGLNLVSNIEKSNSSWYRLVIRYNKSKFNNVSIEEFCKKLILAGCNYVDLLGSTCPLNLLPLFRKPEVLFPNYKGKLNYSKNDFKRSIDFYKSIIRIPIFIDNGDESKKFVLLLKKVVKDIMEDKK